MLEASDLSVKFGGVHALSDVSISVEAGQVVGLVGPNGAGKSTLFNCIAGIITPSEGRVTLDGVDVSGWPAHRRARHGLARTFQTPRIDGRSTVLDAIMTGCSVRMRQGTFGALVASPTTRREERAFRDRARELIEEFRLGDERTLVEELPIAHLRLLEVARSMAADAKYLLLDEPAAGTDDAGLELLAHAIRSLSDRGCGVLLVEHNVGFVMSLCSMITVLTSGRVLVRGTPEQITQSEDVATAYLGAGAA